MTQKLDKGSIHRFFELLDKEVDRDLGQPLIKFTLIAVGGTSLVLRDIKPSTKDFDFMAEDIDSKKMKEYANKIRGKNGLKIDIWDFPNVFSTTLPTDASSDVYPKKYKHFDVKLINKVDNAVTKLSRFNEPDREDIDLIIRSGVKPTEIIRRYNDILRNKGFSNSEEAKIKLNMFERLYLEES